MTLKIDLNNLPGNGKPSPIGDPHWLSGSGKVDRKAIYERNKAKYLATRGPIPRKLASPEAKARLAAAQAHAEKTARVKLVKVWNTAISFLDLSLIHI